MAGLIAHGVNLNYFVNESGFARPTCEMPGPGPTWVNGLVVLTDDQGKEACSPSTRRSGRPWRSISGGSWNSIPVPARFRSGPIIR